MPCCCLDEDLEGVDIGGGRGGRRDDTDDDDDAGAHAFGGIITLGGAEGERQLLHLVFTSFASHTVHLLIDE